MSSVCGGIVRVTETDREEMEVESSSLTGPEAFHKILFSTNSNLNEKWHRIGRLYAF